MSVRVSQFLDMLQAGLASPLLPHTFESGRYAIHPCTMAITVQHRPIQKNTQTARDIPAGITDKSVDQIDNYQL